MMYIASTLFFLISLILLTGGGRVDPIGPAFMLLGAAGLILLQEINHKQNKKKIQLLEDINYQLKEKINLTETLNIIYKHKYSTKL